jgi:RND family efflux transporter MFP subunit
MMRSKPILALTLAALFTVGCGESPVTSAKNTDPAKSPPPRTLSIAVVHAISHPVSANVQATGSFVAEEASDVAPDAAGRVVATPVNVGDFVQAGQVIARLDDRDVQFKLKQAQAAQQQAEAAVRQAQSRIGLGQDQSFKADTVPEVLAAKAAYESAEAQDRLAKADAQRYANLVDSGDVSRSAYDKARTQVDTAEAQVNAARQQYEATLNAARQNYQGVENSQASLEGFRAQLSQAQKAVADTLIHAPFAGYVSARQISAGEYVALTSKIATVLRITPIKLELQVPETNAPQMRVGLQVLANVAGYPGRGFEGRVKAINPSVDSNSRTFTVEAEFPNTDLALKPGMFATGRIALPGSEPGVFVPRRAVITDPTTNSSQVFLVREGKARLAVVQLGESEGENVRILSGASTDAVVALDHLQDLYDGQAVNAQPAAGGN